MDFLSINEKTTPAAILLAVESVKGVSSFEVKEGEKTELSVSGYLSSSVNSILRYLARISGVELKLYGANALEAAEVDNYLEDSYWLNEKKEVDEILKKLDSKLASRVFLVGNSLTIADFAIWDSLTRNASLCTRYKNVSKYLRVTSKKKSFATVASKKNIVIPGMSDKEGSQKDRKGEEGKFVPLPGAKMGEVVVRFPPEASGYLHVGHAKAALLNQHYQNSFKGQLIMRFDDTNPAKESSEFEQVILEDLKLLGIKPDRFTHTSDHFDLISDFCVQMMKEGKAYVDDTDPEQMKKDRETRTNSKNRDNDLAKNLSMWEEMKKGTKYGKTCCVRAKIDMKSNNGCLRDPTMYRCKEEAHIRTGTKYKVYPTYDFACPIVDSHEGVTHALRTTEYRDRDAQYEWFLNAMRIRKPIVYEYARLNLQNIVMSKRKLTWFVEQGIVEGWDDPRFPTVRGVLRRGMTVEGLKQFVIAQGSTKSVNFMEWDKIWAFNKKVIDPVVPRYTALNENGMIEVHISGVVDSTAEVDAHPKNKEVGQKTVYRTKSVFIEHDDAIRFKENENVTFVNWGNIMIKSIKKSGDRITSIDASANLEDTNFKKTIKITWLPKSDEAQLVPITAVHYDHLITKGVLDKDDDFKNFINTNSKKEFHMKGESYIGTLKKGQMIQVQRKGYYIVDVPYEPTSRHSSRCQPVVLILVPDGTQEAQEGQVGSKKVKETKAGKGKAEKSTPASAPSGDTAALNEKITAQGNKIRELKSKKADKATIDAEVKTLLALKAEYKTATGSDWKPGVTPPASAPASASTGNAAALNEKITAQGNKIRELKSKKADKATIDAEVKTLLALKAEYKTATGSDWKPGVTPPASAPASASTGNAAALNEKITAQGNKIRELKSKKADKAAIDAEVKTLLALKAEYKTATGSDWKPGVTPPASASTGNAAALNEKITAQGNKIRELKSKKADKTTIDAEVKTLLALKAEYKTATGSDWKPNANVSNLQSGKKNEKKETKKESEKKPADGGDSSVKKVSRLGLEAQKDDLPEWYSQVITKSDMIEYYDISGCYILRPWAFAIWEAIQASFDASIKKLGVENCYFPMFVSQNALKKEKDHIADFSPEVAWVTECGQSKMTEPVAIRPTSETVMYPSYAKWVQSHRDLPIKLNQWCNVVRWEFKHPQPFLRTREFLWQEGHTAYANKDDAVKEVYDILELYAGIYENLLAIPVVRGRKTEKEKFAGGDFTTTVEAYIPASGRAIQGATSHHLGQNFSKMFDISFENAATGEKEYVYQNSWGLTTRTIGVLVMVHGDNKGLVLPPKIAKYQIVVVPCGITASLKPAEKENILDACNALGDQLNSAGIRTKCDLRDNYSPGWKFNYWELKGVPIRLEVGPRDLKNNEVVSVRRDNGGKSTLSRKNLEKSLSDLLETMQNSMYQKAYNEMWKNIAVTKSFDEFCSMLDNKKLIMSPYCGEIECEDAIKKLSARDAVVEDGAPAMGAKGLCIPLKQPAEIKASDKCICPGCSKKPQFYTMFGRSY